MESLYFFSVLLFLLVLLVARVHKSSNRNLLLMFVSVERDRYDRFIISRIRGRKFKLDKSLKVPDGYDEWKSAFSRGYDFYDGPIVFDDVYKSFLPINPSTVKALNEVSYVKKLFTESDQKPIIYGELRRV